MIKKRGNTYGVTVYDPKTRRKVWVGTYPTQKEARKAERDALDDLERGRRRGTVECDQFARTWIDRFPRRSESTNKHYRERVQKFSRDFAGRKLTDITSSEARDWVLKNMGAHQTVRAMFNDARRDGLVDENPFQNLRLAQSRGRKDLIVPTTEEVAALIHAARTVHGVYGERVFANFIQFTAYTGLRNGEVIALRWSDVDIANREIRVVRQWVKRLNSYGPPKSKKPRTVFMTDQAAEALQRTPRTSDLVFTTPTGKMISGQVHHYWWHPVRCKVDRPDFPFHGLRHFFGTWLANHGVGPIQIAAMLGHQDGGKLAMDRYIHVTEADNRRLVAEQLGSNRGSVVPLRVASGEQHP